MKPLTPIELIEHHLNAALREFEKLKSEKPVSADAIRRSAIRFNASEIARKSFQPKKQKIC